MIIFGICPLVNCARIQFAFSLFTPVWYIALVESLSVCVSNNRLSQRGFCGRREEEEEEKEDVAVQALLEL